jgi:Flp pilus assembly protein TadD
LPQAIEQLEAVLSRDPKNTRALMLSALVYEKFHNLPKEREVRKASSVDPDFAPALNNLAYLHLERLNDLNKAYELAWKARSLLSSDPAVADTLGWALYKRGDYQQALALLQESAQNLPTNPEIQFHLGMATYMMDRMDEARTAFRQAAEAQVLKAKPDYVPALMARATILLQNGDSTPAATIYSGVLQRFPDFAPAQKRLASLYADDPESAKKPTTWF